MHPEFWSVYAVNECEANHESCDPQLAPDTDEYAVRCCSDVEKDGWNSDCAGLWHESDIWAESCQILNWENANSFCQSKGARLCTKQEVEDKCVHDSGCNFDFQLIWTATTGILEF